MKKLRIAYFGNSPNNTAVGDRRRLIFWAKNRGHRIVPITEKQIDCLVFTPKSNLKVPKKLGSCPVILDLADAYSAPTPRTADFIRANVKYLFGELYRPSLSYRKLLMNFVARTDLVVTSSLEQEKLLSGFASRTANILDFHDEIPFVDFDRRIDEKFTIFWEGTYATLSTFLQQVCCKSNVMEHIDQVRLITDSHIPLLLGKYLKIPIHRYIEKLSIREISKLYFSIWSPESLSAAAFYSDLSVIPVNAEDAMSMYKPENRILISWRLGVPVIASSTPSHQRVRSLIPFNFLFSNEFELEELVKKYKRDRELRFEQVRAGKEYLNKFHNRNLLLAKWDAAFEQFQ